MKRLTTTLGILTLGLAMLGVGAQVAVAESDLGISDSQRDQLKALASNTRDRTAREREALRTARAAMLKAYSSYKYDWDKIKSARDKIGSAQLSLLDIHLDNEIALRNILKEDQFKSFREMLKKHLREREVRMIVPREADILVRVPNKQMLDTLNVPSDKQKQLETAGDCTKAVEELKQASEKLLGMYAGYSLDASTARKQIAVVHQKQVTLLWKQHFRQKSLRKILTEEQFNKVQQEIQKRMSAGDQPGRRGPHRGRH